MTLEASKPLFSWIVFEQGPSQARYRILIFHFIPIYFFLLPGFLSLPPPLSQLYLFCITVLPNRGSLFRMLIAPSPCHFDSVFDLKSAALGLLSSHQVIYLGARSYLKQLQLNITQLNSTLFAFHCSSVLLGTVERIS